MNSKILGAFFTTLVVMFMAVAVIGIDYGARRTMGGEVYINGGEHNIIIEAVPAGTYELHMRVCRYNDPNRPIIIDDQYGWEFAYVHEGANGECETVWMKAERNYEFDVMGQATDCPFDNPCVTIRGAWLRPAR